MSGNKLNKAAETVLEAAYAPYSGFRVGAAVVTESGVVHTGCNVENASYGLTLCAERNAIARAVAAEGPAMKIREIYITNRTASGVAVPCSPCGACRQVIAEFATADTLIHYHGEDGIVCKTMAELLPDSFTFSR
ncbi:MAG: cytidine deaminase [Sneathiella sp.]|jgi:cytidine deaminase|uniref:cytidine deaminase n=1 Tax=Sneathiella sp. TaxID=1964365 RepID=UPI000C404437|nr:cytidine deaminase [Sneathiella sp.]MAL78688.1 cytidine deaminase [Sneathiella sp.]